MEEKKENQNIQNDNKNEVVKDKEIQENKETPEKDRKGLALASMILGIVSIVLFFIKFISIPCGILAIVFSALSLKSSKKGFAITGLTTGIIGIALMIVVYFFMLFLSCSIATYPNNPVYDYDYYDSF